MWLKTPQTRYITLDIIGKPFAVLLEQMAKKNSSPLVIFNNKDTKYQKLKKLANFQGTQRPEAYYYVDNIEVFMIENPSTVIV